MTCHECNTVCSGMGCPGCWNEEHERGCLVKCVYCEGVLCIMCAVYNRFNERCHEECLNKRRSEVSAVLSEASRRDGSGLGGLPEDTLEFITILCEAKFSLLTI